MTMPVVKVLIVDDDNLFRHTIHTSLEPAHGIAIVGVAKDHRQATSLIDEVHPDVLLLGISSLSESSLREAMTQICSRFSHLKVIVLHDDGQENLVLEAFKEGATGHLAKGAIRSGEVVEAVHSVNRGDVVLDPRVAGSILDEIVQKRLLSSPDSNQERTVRS